LVYSDDLALRLVARNEQRVHSFWTQTLLQDLLDKGLISPDEYYRAVARLIESGFHFVSVNHTHLLWAIRDNSCALSPRVSKVVGTLAGPDCALNDAVTVALDVLHELWADPVPRATKLALLDLMIQVLVTGRNAAAVLAAMNAKNTTRSLIWTSATNEIQQNIKLWFFARSKALVPSGSRR
jgi:hypothetical protein